MNSNMTKQKHDPDTIYQYYHALIHILIAYNTFINTYNIQHSYSRKDIHMLSKIESNNKSISDNLVFIKYRVVNNKKIG